MRLTSLVLIVFSLSACNSPTPPPLDPAKGQNLFAAIKNGETENVRTIAQSDPRLAKSLDPSKATPVLCALYHEKPEVAKVLVESGFELSLPEAAAYGDRDAVSRLLKSKKSSVNSYSDDGFTPLHLACFFGRGDIVTLLLENGADINAQSQNKFHATPLQSAAAARKEQVGEILLKAHANPNCKGDGGYSPLHEVASNGQISFAELLLRHGAQVNFRGDDGKTPLTIAQETKQEAMAQFLREKAGTK